MLRIIRDARRYRWLRAQNWTLNTLTVVSHPKEVVRVGAFCPSEDRLDDAIDEAMRKPPPPASDNLFVDAGSRANQQRAPKLPASSPTGLGPASTISQPPPTERTVEPPTKCPKCGWPGVLETLGGTIAGVTFTAGFSCPACGWMTAKAVPGETK